MPGKATKAGLLDRPTSQRLGANSSVLPRARQRPSGVSQPGFRVGCVLRLRRACRSPTACTPFASYSGRATRRGRYTCLNDRDTRPATRTADNCVPVPVEPDRIAAGPGGLRDAMDPAALAACLGKYADP